jgi:hypothetical protein
MKILILSYLGIAVVGSRLPFIRVFLVHCYNIVSQVISVCLEGGRKNKIKLFPDGSAVTTGNIASPFKKALITYAGYTGTSIVAIGLFYLVSKGSYYLVIYLFLGFITLTLVLWIRNLFGVIWALSLWVLLALPVYFRSFGTGLPIPVNYDLILTHISIFLAAILFVQSIICAFQVCKQCFMSKNNPARKSALFQTKFVPAVFLGLTLVGQTIYVGYFFVQKFIGLPFGF